MKSVVAVLALAACGDDNVVPPCPDAAVCDGACVATFTGNYHEATMDPASCAQITPELAFTIASPVIGAPLEVRIDLGASPAIGMFSSETVASWSAVQARSIDNGGCVYSAGDEVVPHGSFTLMLTAIDEASAHGTLHILEYVHAIEGTPCGAGDTETVDLVF